MEIIIAAINVIWLWICLAPALLIIAIFLIRLGLRSTSNQTSNKPTTTHKHNWEDVTDLKDPEYKTEILSNWSARYHTKWQCRECGDEHHDSNVSLL